MPRRHESLIPLTHDHHHTLVQARRLVAATDAGDDERRNAAEDFVRFYEADTLLHFHEEEEMLFPLLLEQVDDAPPELVKVLVEHVAIHGLVGRLRDSIAEGAVDGALLRDLGETLQGHVRLEESKLFPMIERIVPEPELGEIAFAPRRRS